MKVKELIHLLQVPSIERYLDEDVKVRLSIPSVGPVSTSNVHNAYFGFDWDKGLILKTEQELVPKTKEEGVHQMAVDLLMYLATKPNKKETYEIRTAKAILLKNGYTDEEFIKFRSIYHRE